MSTERRNLQFDHLDQVTEELNRLLASGYTQTGNWDLAQISGHLNDWMRYSIDGYPRAPAPIRLVLWLMKITIGRRQLAGVLKHGFKAGLPTMPATVPKPNSSSDRAAAERLIDTIDRFQAHDGPFAASPIYGTLTRDEARQLQLRHCAHHLGFLRPNI